MVTEKRLSRKNIGRQAFAAILKMDVEEIKRLAGLGLDLNDIDMSGVSEKYVNSLKYGKIPSLRMLKQGRRVSALHILFIAVGQYSSMLMPEFVGELGKLGVDLNMEFFNETTKTVSTPLSLFFDKFIGKYNKNEFHSGEPWRDEETLMTLLAFGCKADRIYSARLDVISNENTFKIDKYRIDEYRTKLCDALYKLELAGGIDIYKNKEYEHNPTWLDEYFKLNRTSSSITTRRVCAISNTNLRKVYIPSANGRCYKFGIKNYSIPDEKVLLQRYILCPDIKTIQLSTFENLFYRMQNEIELGTVDPLGENSYFALLRQLLRRRFKNTETDIQFSIVLDILAVRMEENSPLCSAETDALCGLLYECLKSQYVLDLLRNPDQSELYTKAQIFWNGHGCLFYSPIGLKNRIITQICEACIREKIDLMEVFPYALRDLIFLSMKQWYGSFYRKGCSSSDIDDCSCKIDLISSYGWDINGRDKIGNTPLHNIFLKNISLRKVNNSISPMTGSCLDYGSSNSNWRESVLVVFKLLQSKGCDFAAQNKEGKTAADLLVNENGQILRGCTAIYHILKDFEKKSKYRDKEIVTSSEVEMSW